jgi:hypothetical protein
MGILTLHGVFSIAKPVAERPGRCQTQSLLSAERCICTYPLCGLEAYSNVEGKKRRFVPFLTSCF